MGGEAKLLRPFCLKFILYGMMAYVLFLPGDSLYYASHLPLSETMDLLMLLQDDLWLYKPCLLLF